MTRQFKSYLLLSLFITTSEGGSSFLGNSDGGSGFLRNSDGGSGFVKDTHHSSFAYRASFPSDDNSNRCLWIIGAAIVCGMAIYKACQWSDDDILNWARTGVTEINTKYQNLTPHDPSIIDKLQTFGANNAVSWGDNQRYVNLDMAPLHKALLIINDDLHHLCEYDKHLMQRGLRNIFIDTGEQAERALLEKLKDIIEKSDEYAREKGIVSFRHPVNHHWRPTTNNTNTHPDHLPENSHPWNSPYFDY